MDATVTAVAPERQHEQSTGNRTSSRSMDSSATLFRAVAERDYDGLLQLYAKNATDFVHTFLAMKQRRSWSHSGGHTDSAYRSSKAEEKLDEYVMRDEWRRRETEFQYDPTPLSHLSPLSRAREEDDRSYDHLLRELARYTDSLSHEQKQSTTQHENDGNNNEGHDDQTDDRMDTTGSSDDPVVLQRYVRMHPDQRHHQNYSSRYHTHSTAVALSGHSIRHPPTPDGTHCISKEADRLLWEASAILSDSRPPSTFIVYDKQGSLHPPTPSSNSPPIYDGSVANTTPPAIHHHLGTLSSPGSGTVLHLACAMDQPLLLAFLLCAGADARAPHTAFRRLLIHEAACNGSLQCLQLLLELGERFAHEEVVKQTRHSKTDLQFPMSASMNVNPDRRHPSMSSSSFLQNLPLSPKQLLNVPLVLPRSSYALTPRSMEQVGAVSQASSFPSAVGTQQTHHDSHLRHYDNHHLQQQTRQDDALGIQESPIFQPRSIDSVGCMGDRVASKYGQQQQTDAQMADYLSLLRTFQNCVVMVRCKRWTALDAARYLMERHSGNLLDTTKATLTRSCSFISPDAIADRLRRQCGQCGNNLTPSSGRTNRSMAYSGSQLSCFTQVSSRLLGSISSSRPFPRPCSDGHGNTPLHWAAFKNERECVSLLLRYGADPNARAYPSGWTPLHDAAYSNSFESIDLLLDAGAQIDARANSGATPLCFAAQEDAAEAAEVLLKQGANLTARCANGPLRDDNGGHRRQHIMPHPPHSRFSGYTPLHYCAHYNAHRAAKFLLQHPSAQRAMETPDLSERLPIHVAVARGSSDVLRELLHAGARIDVRPQKEQRQNVRSPSPTPPRNRTVEAELPRRTGGAGNNAAHNVSPETPLRQASAPERLATPLESRRMQWQQQRTVSDSSGSTSSRSPSNLPPEILRTLSFSSSSSSSSITMSPGTPVSSPVLRSMIPTQPITSSKPWNCLTQTAIDECRNLISQAEKPWSPDRHLLFTPRDRRAVVELLRVGKRLEMQGTGIFTELWPLVLSFCGRGWFDTDTITGAMNIDGAANSGADSPFCRRPCAMITVGESMDSSALISEINSQDDYDMEDGSSNDNDDFLALPALSR